MKTFENQAAQGDLLITKIDSLPENLKQVMPEDGNIVVAHSETGHNHVVFSEDVTAYHAANDDFVMYLVVNKETELKHLRSFDTHESIKVREGIYRINRQREYIPDGFRRVAD